MLMSVGKLALFIQNYSTIAFVSCGNDQIRYHYRKKMGISLAMTCDLGSILRNSDELHVCNSCGIVNFVVNFYLHNVYFLAFRHF